VSNINEVEEEIVVTRTHIDSNEEQTGNDILVVLYMYVLSNYTR